ncbi:MAG: ABC transporter ATP-binding protein [Pseudomonadota bacterium]
MSAENETVMLALDNVSLSYHTGREQFDHGSHHVLNRVSLKVYEGETLGIIGRNGVGKSTLLRLMSGILAPTDGEVYQHPGKSCALLTLGLGFRPDLSGRNNAKLAAMLQGASEEEAQSHLEEIKAFSELGDSFEEPVKTYSSGMRARLGFTTALKTHVDILLIDEVLSVGDAQFRQKAAQAMRKRIKSEQTVVFVSHMEAQIRRICNRAIYLDAGHIVAEGEPKEVMRAYRRAARGDAPARRQKKD